MAGAGSSAGAAGWGGRLALAVLGSTGSVGRQALEVAAAWPEKVGVVALAAGRSAELLFEQARAFAVERLALAKAPDPPAPVPPAGASVGYGAREVAALASLPEADCVLNALVGAAGLEASHAALASGKRLALANKESLVVGGDLLMPMAAPGQMIPVDSEHSAIFQCLQGEDATEVERIWLTASGGPFRGRSRRQLADVTAAEALAHPTWAMGSKISIDSATMMNKGLEVIEAMHLFGLPLERISIVVHPQSVVHSMVEFKDGSVKAHLGPTDMRLPIQYALSYPERWASPLAPLDFTLLGELAFEAPDLEAFGCLGLALEAARIGGTAPCVLNAANEVAVEAFLSGQIGFLGIEACIAAVLEGHQSEPVVSVEQLKEVDSWARRQAELQVRSLST